ncbi:25S rRNA (uracil2634-N3)-methyltransferase [Sarracenia purpurea var. burkii]
MTHDTRLNSKIFDRIVFNFPHAGFDDGYREHSARRIKRHRGVVRRFLRSARGMLSSKGEVHVTHKTAYAFNKWKVEVLAENEGLCLIEEALFSKFYYPGYENKRGDGSKSNDTFPVGQCSTFKFAMPKVYKIIS